MSIMEREGAVNGAAYESFYQEGMRARHVSAQEEREPGRIGLLPYGGEALYLGDAYYAEQTHEAIGALVDYYQRFADHQQGIARIGKHGLGLALSIHEAPVPYAVLAIEEPASYHQGIKHPGTVRCVIDVLAGAATDEGRLQSGRYFERHPYETPGTEASTASARQFAPFDYSLVRRAGERARLQAERRAAVSHKIAEFLKVS